MEDEGGRGRWIGAVEAAPVYDLGLRRRLMESEAETRQDLRGFTPSNR